MKGKTKRKMVLGIMLILLLTGISTLTLKIQPLRASCAPTTSGTITIMADGSIDPPTATDLIERDGDVYTFAKNIYFDSLVVERDDVVVDGAGHVLQGTGTGSGNGITLLGVSGVTVKNVEIKGFSTGIWIDTSSGDNVVSGNNITNNWWGIRIDTSNDNTFSRNIIESNHAGIMYYEAVNNIISANTIAYNDFGLWRNLGSIANIIYHNNLVDNTVQVFYADYAPGPDIWDDGYPSGGNYWSDYEDRYPSAVDENHGENQDIPDGDGIWDQAYTWRALDRYPLCLPKKAYIPVPYHSQTLGTYCGPASVQMVFDYYGPEISQDEIAEAAAWQEPPAGGTGPQDRLRAARFSDLSTSDETYGVALPGTITGYTERGLGYVAYYGTLSRHEVKALLSQGYPVLVTCQLTNTITGDTFSHVRVLVGYDDERTAPGFIIHDPLEEWWGNKLNLTYSEFETGYTEPGHIPKWSGNIYRERGGGGTGMVTCPWDVSLSFSTQSINEGDIFTVEAEVTFPCPTQFSGPPWGPTHGDAFDQCQATIELPSGLSPAPTESITKTLGTGEMLPGESASVTWDIVAEVGGNYEIRVEAEERWEYWIEDHPVYYEDTECVDRVGGTACARAPPIRVSTATGTGTAAFTSDNGTLIDLEAVDLSTLPPHPDGLVGFPDGLFSFTIEGLEHGQEVTVLIELVSPFPEGSLYWKCQNDNWYSLPIGSDDGDNFITVTLTDGGVGDAIAGPDGKIEDPGGPGTPPLIEGDVNGDGIVDIEDVVIAALCFGSTVAEPNIVGSPYDPRADLNNDGIIDIFDLVIIGINYGNTL